MRERSVIHASAVWIWGSVEGKWKVKDSVYIFNITDNVDNSECKRHEYMWLTSIYIYIYVDVV